MTWSVKYLLTVEDLGSDVHHVSLEGCMCNSSNGEFEDGDR